MSNEIIRLLRRAAKDCEDGERSPVTGLSTWPKETTMEWAAADCIENLTKKLKKAKDKEEGGKMSNWEVKWIGPYPPTEGNIAVRHADPITIDHIIELRKDILKLEKRIEVLQDVVKDNHNFTKEVYEERQALRSALLMWVKYWEASGDEDVFLAEEAMEVTREALERVK